VEKATPADLEKLVLVVVNGKPIRVRKKITWSTKYRAKRALKEELWGASATGFLVSLLLHNFLYGLSVITHHISTLHYLFEFLHAVFFIIAISIMKICN